MTHRLPPPSLFAIGLALAFAGPVTAAEPDHVRIVRYDDLNLSSPGGAQQLKARLERASDQVCADHLYGRSGLEPVLQYRACRDAAFTAAVDALPTAVASAVGAQPSRWRLAHR